MISYREIFFLECLLSDHSKSSKSSISDSCSGIQQVFAEYTKACRDVLKDLVTIHSLGSCIIENDLGCALNVSNHSHFFSLTKGDYCCSSESGEYLLVFEKLPKHGLYMFQIRLESARGIENLKGQIPSGLQLRVLNRGSQSQHFHVQIGTEWYGHQLKGSW